jgi:hypothetical protein
VYWFNAKYCTNRLKRTNDWFARFKFEKREATAIDSSFKVEIDLRSLARSLSSLTYAPRFLPPFSNTNDYISKIFYEIIGKNHTVSSRVISLAVLKVM